MLSKSSKYAIKAVLFLALNSSRKHKVAAKDISAPINVPQAYVAKLLQQLVKEKIISSIRGPKGGFYLNEDNLNKTVINIIYTIEGEKKQNACMLSLEKCNVDKPCPLHNLLQASRNEILKNLKRKTVKELSLEVKLGNAFLPL